jgi:hypothetical protein
MILAPAYVLGYVPFYVPFGATGDVRSVRDIAPKGDVMSKLGIRSVAHGQNDEF